MAEAQGGAVEARSRLPRVRPTRAGWCTLALTGALSLAGANSSVNVLFLLSGVLFGALVVSFIGAWRQLARVSVSRELPEHVHAGEGFTVSLTLSNRKRRAAHALLVEDSAPAAGETWRAFAPQVAGRGLTVLRYVARAAQREVVSFGGVRLSTIFPFGLVRATVVRLAGPQDELVVYPALGTVRPSFLQGQIMGVRERASLQPSRIGTTDVHGLREYRSGDNPKWIHWRSSARLGKPLVKEFDREEARRLHVVLDAALPPGEEDDGLSETAPATQARRLEQGVSFAATLASASTRATREVGLTALGLERVDLAPAAGVAQVHAILTALARLQPTRVPQTPEPRLERHVLRNTAVIVVVLDADRLRHLPLSAWQEPGGTVRVIDVSQPSFQDWFVPPPVLV
jgi:uncharacterized protein (DUF58 family)